MGAVSKLQPVGNAHDTDLQFWARLHVAFDLQSKSPRKYALGIDIWQFVAKWGSYRRLALWERGIRQVGSEGSGNHHENQEKSLQETPYSVYASETKKPAFAGFFIVLRNLPTG